MEKKDLGKIIAGIGLAVGLAFNPYNANAGDVNIPQTNTVKQEHVYSVNPSEHLRNKIEQLKTYNKNINIFKNIEFVEGNKKVSLYDLAKEDGKEDGKSLEDKLDKNDYYETIDKIFVDSEEKKKYASFNKLEPVGYGGIFSNRVRSYPLKELMVKYFKNQEQEFGLNPKKFSDIQIYENGKPIEHLSNEAKNAIIEYIMHDKTIGNIYQSVPQEIIYKFETTPNNNGGNGGGASGASGGSGGSGSGGSAGVGGAAGASGGPGAAYNIKLNSKLNYNV